VRGPQGKAAEKKEFSANHVGDTTRDNASSKKVKGLVSDVEDSRIWGRDKCRVVAAFWLLDSNCLLANTSI
jgi:hypothetical protein